METATKYTKEPLETLYPLEWEERAYQEVLQGFKAIWKQKRGRFLELARENESIALEEKNLPNLQSGSKELVDLYEAIFHQLIFPEPYLYRMLAYINMTSEDREARQAFYEKHLEPVNFAAYDDILDIDILQGSALAGRNKLSGIPLHTCFVGQVLGYLLNTVNHYYLVDQVKLSGAAESIAELRITRGKQETNDGIISDYSPLFKHMKSSDMRTHTFEVFKQDDFEPKRWAQYADNILCSHFIKANRDRRQDLFFGSMTVEPESKE